MLNRLCADYYHGKIKDNVIINFINTIPSGETLLDVGAGEMPYKIFCNNIRYTSQDFCKYDGKGDNKGIQTRTFNTDKVDIVSDISMIPVDDNSYSNIICTEVLEHVINPNDAIEEMFRILKPGGKLLIGVPGTSLLHFSPYHYYTGFKPNYFIKIFAENKLLVDRIVRVGSIYSVIALYIWFISQKISNVVFPLKPSLLFRVVIIFTAPIIFMLLLLDKIKKLNPETLEAGIIVIGTKK
jgi:SAM-dependent methyltransferase